MRKNNWFKRHEKGIVTGFCAAVLTVTGAAGYHIQDSYGYTYAYDKNGVTFVTPGDGTGYASNADAEWAVEDELVQYGLGDYREKSYEYTDTETAIESADDYWIGGDSELYESLGLEMNEKKRCWTYEGKPVRIIWVEDGGFSSWGNTDRESSTYIYVQKEKGDGSVTYRLKEMTLEEISKLYNKTHPGSWIE